MKRKAFVVSLAIIAAAASPTAFGQVKSQTGPAPASPAPTTPSQAAPAAPSPAAIDVVTTLQKACLPILRGERVEAAARSAGFRLQDGGWVRPIAGKEEINLDPPDTANPHVCTLTITTGPSDVAAMRGQVASWAAAQSPPLASVGVQSAPGAAQGWVTSTWTAQTPSGAESVVLTQPQAPTEQSSAQTQQSTLLVSLSPT